MDSDFVENIHQVRGLLDAIENQNCDGVIGSRFVEGGKVVGYPFLKHLMNRLFHVVARTLFQIQQNDLTNNFKLYKAGIFQSMPWKSDGFALNAETGIWPVLFGYKLIEVPVLWIERRPDMGKSKFDIFKHGGAYIRVILDGFQLISEQKKGARQKLT
jgi:hypothetical protein